VRATCNPNPLLLQHIESPKLWGFVGDGGMPCRRANFPKLGGCGGQPGFASMLRMWTSACTIRGLHAELTTQRLISALVTQQRCRHATTVELLEPRRSARTRAASVSGWASAELSSTGAGSAACPREGRQRREDRVRAVVSALLPAVHQERPCSPSACHACGRTVGSG